MSLSFVEFSCPHCGSNNAAGLDLSQGASQEWITDCEVCCRPVVVTLRLNGDRIGEIIVRKENE